MNIVKMIQKIRYNQAVIDNLQHSGKFKRRLNFRELQSDYESTISETEEDDKRKYVTKKIEDVKKQSSTGCFHRARNIMEQSYYSSSTGSLTIMYSLFDKLMIYTLLVH